MRIDQFRTIESWVDYTLAISNPDKLHKDSIWNGGSYHGETPLGESWGIVYVYAPNVAELLEDSNWEVLLDRLYALFGNQEDTPYTVENIHHWATPLRYLIVELINTSGKPTEIAEYIHNALMMLSDYPVLDEEDFSKRESEAQDSALTGSLHYAANRSDYWAVINEDSLIAYAYQNFDRAVSDSEGWLDNDIANKIVDQYIRKVMGYEFMGI